MIISIRELFRNRDDARDPTWHGGITNQLFPYSPRFHDTESDGLHYVVQIPTFKHHPSL